MTEQMTQTEDLVNYILQHSKADLAGNTDALIVALPRAMDPVRLVGDEDKHATLLYFGAIESLPSDAKNVLTETLLNVSRLFTPFGEMVRSISRLGSDVPPALVALLGNEVLGKIREAALINPKIGDYLTNATQYPSYTPHVTLGYPDYQEEAKLRPLAENLRRIRFDRLALWWGEEQIEFSLEMFEEGMMHQEELVDNFLAHFGVKGMKWGVRKDTSSGGTLIKPKRRTVPLLGDAGDDRGFKRKVGNYGSVATGDIATRGAAQAGAIAIVSSHITGTMPTVSGGTVATVSSGAYAAAMGVSAAGQVLAIPAALATKAYFQPLSTAYHSSKGEIRRETKALNQKYSTARKNLSTDKSLQKQYHSEYKKIVETALNRSKSGWTHPFRALAEKRVGKTSENEYKLKFNLNPSNTRKPYLSIHGPAKFASEVKLGSFKHDDILDSDDLITTYEVELTYDLDGFIEDFEIVPLEKFDSDGELVHIEDATDNFLEHFGVKGMRWGVRRTDAQLGSLNRKQAKIAKAQAKIDEKQAKLDAKSGKSGAIRIGPKTDDGDVVDVHVSADAERFVKTQLKSGVQMSDREIKEAVQRANLVKQYNEAFKKDPNAELRAKADAIELHKKIADLTAKPSVLPKINRLLETSSKGFEAYSKLNKATGGALNKKMKLEFGQDYTSKLARSIRSTGTTADIIAGKTPGVSAGAIKSLKKSKTLRDEVDTLLRYAGDGTVQEKLF